MRYPPHEFTAAETCIAAIYAYCGFFIATVAVHVCFGGSPAEKPLVAIAGAIGLVFLARSWLRQIATRGHIANLALLVTALLIATEVAATIAA